jgi:hypothetical protein
MAPSIPRCARQLSPYDQRVISATMKCQCKFVVLREWPGLAGSVCERILLYLLDDVNHTDRIGKKERIVAMHQARVEIRITCTLTQLECQISS